MVQGRKINEVTVGGVTVSVWKAEDPAQPHHNNFQVDVGMPDDDNWVCVGGGGRGHVVPGSYLTASFPSDDFKSWNLRSRDHIDDDPWTLTGFAIGMRIPGLTKEELISNLKIFKHDSIEANHPETSAFVEDDYLLLGGGAHVTKQPSEAPGSEEVGGNMLTGSFINSTISWCARSKDHFYFWQSPITAFAIGIRQTLKKQDGSVFGTVVTTFNSLEIVPQEYQFSEITVRPLTGFALCGGGVAARYRRSVLIWAMEPTPLENFPTPQDPNPPPVILDYPNKQTFTGKVKDGRTHYEGYGTGLFPGESAHLTAYAMGIKFQPISIPCDRVIPITDAKSDVTLNPVGLPESNVKDGDLNTKWMSKVTQNPSIRLNLQDQKPVCKVDIAWGEGNMRKYKFTIEVSTDNQNWGTPIFTDQSKGTTTDYESYVVPPTPTKFVRVTVTDSGLGATGNSQAQILEIRVFSNQ